MTGAIGIYGGTFDPVHLGHLRSALEVRNGLGLDQVNLMPNRSPPHRDEPGVSAAARLQMLQLAVRGVDGLGVDDRELRRQGPSYTVTSLEELRTESPQRSLCLILGSDAFFGLPQWHQWHRVIELAHIVVVQRPGHAVVPEGPLSDLVAGHRAESLELLRRQPAGWLWFQPVRQLEIASSEIRKLINSGENPRFLLPDVVYAYISRHDLYKLKDDRIDGT
ncbi:MAG: nicotinate-nucleotide adenylyltransferase [Gammaproteobacteria bacterium]|nr:nicotinate-nucleotide adenylyltransferase [Gammaproteobacteria bacterium]